MRNQERNVLTGLLLATASLSDAEDFTEGYRSLKLGTVVGEPTAGWIIFTWNQPMMDGSVLRLPRMRITATDGSEMEMKPRPVDVPVTRALANRRRAGTARSRPRSRSCCGKLPNRDVAAKAVGSDARSEG